MKEWGEELGVKEGGSWDTEEKAKYHIAKIIDCKQQRAPLLFCLLEAGLKLSGFFSHH